MPLLSIALLALISLSALVIYKYLIHPLFLSPLARIRSAHWSAPLSRLWILNARRQELETFAIHAAHSRLGPIIRIAPNELSVNNVDGGIRTIYSGGYEKGTWYSNVFCNYGVSPMFAMSKHGEHSKRKRMLSNVYAKSTLQGSKGLDAITETLINDRLIPRLRELGASGEPSEFYFLLSAIVTDFVSSYIFGLSQGSNFTQDPGMGKKFFWDYKARQRFQFWPQDLPSFTRWMGKWVVPEWVGAANGDIEAWVMGMCEGAEEAVRRAEGEERDWPTVYAQLRSALVKEDSAQAESEGKDVDVAEIVRKRKLDTASELLDHTLAGFDTSSITLTFLAWELSKPAHIPWQERLRSELAECHSKDAKELDALPILHAILMETLRLHAAIPGNQPRITPPNATLGPYTNLPANIRVQSQAWSLHREPTVFPDPASWDPSRWLPPTHSLATSSEAQQREMQRWFWAFGSGGRMCVGSNLAMLDMKAIIAGIWGRFRTEGVGEGKGMRHNGGYVAEPVGWEGEWCLLRVEELSSGNAEEQ
ncbi:hypothetical protein LTR37_009911 [Vermiconidia calcicola]|uniref:Uncharacterized protein n=1 Tax=Vermiconidia calcicola TaxID=1690605 RepID=A0ACC3N6I1_9PEZI|nr:hypothetical protein LTR37_009911 [Vermiconidia calcicola]